MKRSEKHSSFHALPVRDESETHLWQWCVASEDPTAPALPKTLSFPEPRAAQSNGSRTSSTGSQKSTTPVYAMQQALSKVRGVLLMRPRVAKKNTSMRDDREAETQSRELDNGESLGIISGSCWGVQRFVLDSSDYRGLLTYCWHSGYPFMTKTPFNSTPITPKIPPWSN